MDLSPASATNTGLGPTKISSEGWRWINVNVVLLALAAIAIGLRLYARKLRGKPFVFNDYTIVLSLIFSAGFSAVQIIAAMHGGVGFDIVEVIETMGGLNAIVVMLKCLLASEMLYPVAMALVKISVVHFYATIFPSRTFFRVACVVMGLAAATAVATILDAFLGCRPFAYNWDKTIHGGTCGNETLAYLIPCIINLIIDVVVVILPLPVLWTLKMRLPRKIAVMLIFSMGIAVCVVSGIRLRAIYSLDLINITSSVVDLGFWTALEPLLGIINACLPMLQPIVKACFARLNSFLKSYAALDDGKQSGALPASHEGKVMRPANATVSMGSRIFRRLYDHIYPFTTQLSEGLDSEATRVGSQGGDVEALNIEPKMDRSWSEYVLDEMPHAR